MKSFIRLAIIGLSSFTFANAEYIGTYYAKLAEVDHFNSSGVELTNVAAIIRQDRYNYHIRGIRQFGDTWDAYFSNKGNRATMERMLRRGYLSRSARRAILYGTPLIRVEIYRDHVNVKVINKIPRSVIN